jgi:hypothetical protein
MSNPGPGLFEAVIESWRLVIGNAGALARVALLPFLIFVALHRLEAAFDPEGLGVLVWSLLFRILAAVPAAILLMPWYRRLLVAANPGLASQPAMGWTVILMLRWVGLEIMFFAALTPITAIWIQTLATGAEPAPGVSGMTLFYIATFIIGVYLFYGRMGLAIPAAAAESDHSYRHSWATTAAYGRRISVAIILCWLSIQIPTEMLREPLATDNPTLAIQYLDAALAALFSIVNELLAAAVFAQFYLARTAPPLEGEW